MKDKKNFMMLLIESVLLFCSSGAYFFWFSRLAVFLSLLTVIFPLIMTFSGHGKLDYNRLPIILGFSFIFAIHTFVIGGSLLYTIMLSIIPLFLFVPSSLRSSIIDFYVLKAFPVLLAFSVGAYILEGLNITHLPVFSVEPLNDAKQYYYISHIFFLQDSNALTDFARFNSYYEECGVIGSMVALFLFSHGERMPLWVKLLYILTGFMTFSLFFYVMFLLYIIISAKGLKGSKRLGSVFGLLVVAVIAGYFVLQNYENDFIEIYLTNRFSVENGEWAGHDRETNVFMQFFWNDFIFSNDFWFGTTRVKSQGWSIYRCIVENGILVVAITMALYIICIMRNKTNKNRWIYLIAFFAMFYQRPEFWSVFYFVFFTTISDSASPMEHSFQPPLNVKTTKERINKYIYQKNI